MSRLVVLEIPLLGLLSRAGRAPAVIVSEGRDSRTDSIVAPSEAPRRDDVPDWLGFTPDIQRLLR